MLVDLGPTISTRLPSRYGEVSDYVTSSGTATLCTWCRRCRAPLRDDQRPWTRSPHASGGHSQRCARCVQAMEPIESKHEPTRRGLYGGIVGYPTSPGNATPRIAIRRILAGEGGRPQAGAGVVADGDPVRLHRDCQNKLAVLNAIAAAGNDTPAPGTFS